MHVLCFLVVIVVFAKKKSILDLFPNDVPHLLNTFVYSLSLKHLQHSTHYQVILTFIIFTFPCPLPLDHRIIKNCLNCYTVCSLKIVLFSQLTASHHLHVGELISHSLAIFLTTNGSPVLSKKRPQIVNILEKIKQFMNTLCM